MADERERESRQNARGRSPLVCAVTVNWNGLSDTIECVRSLLDQTFPLHEIVIVDNGSEQGDAEALRAHFGNRATVLETGRNLGCGRGYNAGIERARATCHTDYVMVLNNDITAGSTMTEELVRYAETHVRIGAAGPKVYHSLLRGRTDIIWSAGGATYPFSPQIHRFTGCGEHDCGQYETIRPVDWLAGAVMLLRTSALADAGGFNPRYFAGLEDAELCHLFRKHGYQITYVPTARAWHKVGASARKASIHYVNLPAHYYYIARCFPWYAAAFQFALMPLTVLRWTAIYVARIRNPAALRRSLSDSVVFMKALTYGTRES